MGKKIVSWIAALAVTAGLGLAVTAPTAEAASYGTGTVTKKEGRKVVREADKQKCLTLKEVRKIVKGKGTYAGDGDYVWYGKGSVSGLVVSFDDWQGGNRYCADVAGLVYDNGSVYVWAGGSAYYDVA